MNDTRIFNQIIQLPELTKNRKDIEWLWERTLFLTAHGSHAYGTSLPTSDRDYKGFCVPPKEYILGYAKRFEQAEFKGDPDMVVYGVQKFFKLAADCSPSIIEVLFTAPSDHIFVSNGGRAVLAKKELFLSKKAKHTFSGYAISQLKKIRSHKRWLSDPPKAAPVRADFGLPERTIIPADQLQAAQSLIREQLDTRNVPIDELDPAAKIVVQERFVEALTLIEIGYRAQVVAELEAQANVIFDDAHTWKTSGPEYERAAANEERGYRYAMKLLRTMPGVDLEKVAGNLLGFNDNFLELLDRERHYRNKQEEWRSYQGWLANRNPARSVLEAKWGYDTKHGMHLIRLMRMCREILEGKGVQVKRPDAQELLAIRNGLWTYEELLAWAEQQEKDLEVLYKTSPLPNSPPVKAIDELLIFVVESSL